MTYVKHSEECMAVSTVPQVGCNHQWLASMLQLWPCLMLASLSEQLRGAAVAATLP
jgi:hypothetical protein